MPQAERPQPTNIVLTGFMGTGKTTIGRIVAEQLGFVFIDTDEMIEQRHGAIAEIFAQQGEEAFRAIEREVATEVAAGRGQVVSTGGRLLLDHANEISLGISGVIVCLTATVDQILERVLADSSRVERPLLAGDNPRQRVIDLLSERAEGYGRFVQVDTGGRPPPAIANDVITIAAESNLMTEPAASTDEQDNRRLGLADAYSVATPDDNRRLYGDWASSYESEFIEPRGYVYHENVADLFVGVLGSASASSGSPVLDVGCGTGIVGVALRERGVSSIDGLDLSAAMLEQASAKTHGGQPVYDSLIEADLTQTIDLASDHYRGVVSVGTFTHGHLGPQSIDELVRIASPGAPFAIGINAEHYESHGFADYFAGVVAAGAITEPALTAVRMYAEADDEHSDDLAMVATFTKATGD